MKLLVILALVLFVVLTGRKVRGGTIGQQPLPPRDVDLEP